MAPRTIHTVNRSTTFLTNCVLMLMVFCFTGANNVLGGDSDPSIGSKGKTELVDRKNDNSVISGASSSVADTLINLIQWPISEGGNDHWYAILPTLLMWFDADSAAPTYELGGVPGYLGTIITPEENNFILNQVISGTNQNGVLDQFWLGGTWFRTGSWEWDTGEPFEFMNWSPGEPNSLPDESVLAIWGFNETDPRRPAGKWNNAPPDLTFCSCHIFWSIIEWGDNVEIVSSCGDTDGDGEITWMDVDFLVSYYFLFGPPPQPVELGDANGNGIIDIGDIVQISNFLNGLSDSPCSSGPPNRPGLDWKKKPEERKTNDW